MKTLAQKLNAKIRLNYHSIREAALQIGVNQSLLSQIVNGNRPISAQYAIKIAPYVDISPQEALALAGHNDLAPLLLPDASTPRPNLTETCTPYTATAQEIANLIAPLSDCDKHTALELLRTYVREVTKP